MYIWRPNKPKSVLSMKALYKILLIVLSVSFVLAGASCSSKKHGFNYKSDPKRGATSYDPVARKNQPVRKKFIVNGKRKAILGHEKPLSN
jgi:hypothetical protein